eukprot:4233316-Amphidinium_carterae.1
MKRLLEFVIRIYKFRALVTSVHELPGANSLLCLKSTQAQHSMKESVLVLQNFQADWYLPSR